MKPLNGEALAEQVSLALGLTPDQHAKYLEYINISDRTRSNLHQIPPDQKIGDGLSKAYGEVDIDLSETTDNAPKARPRDITTASWHQKDRTTSAHTSQADLTLPQELKLEFDEILKDV